MGVWILEGDADGSTRAVLIDSVTERPLNVPAFEDREAADSFLTFAKTRGVDDVRRIDDAALDNLHTDWIALPKCQQCGERVVQPGELPNECEGCRPPCDWRGGDCDARGTEVMRTDTPMGLDRYCSFHAAQVRRQKQPA